MFKRMLKTILNVILFICLVILTYLTLIRGQFLEMVNAKTDSLDLNINALKNYSSTDLHEYLDDYLKENDIPTNIIDEVLENNAQKEVLENYVQEVITATKDGTTIPNLPTSKVEEILTDSIKKYNEKYDTNISPAKAKKVVDDVAKKVDSVLNFVNQNANILKSFRLLLNDTLYYIILILTFLIIIIIAFLYKKESIFSLGGISLFNAVGTFTTYLIVTSSLQNFLKFLPIELKQFQNSFLIATIIFTITGIILLILYKILDMHEGKKKTFKS